jgi:hypothetical protein
VFAHVGGFATMLPVGDLKELALYQLNRLCDSVLTRTTLNNAAQAQE